MSSGLFLLAHLVIVLTVLAALVLEERRGRRTWTSWHRGVRTRHLTSDEMLRRLRKARR
ncbi:hypothetical protein RHAL1_03847 [Beijerinckiaceae bacterium RH AL1]|nr:hypothetical protein [Beijerinckiaceae bacterium]VVB49457.1 hypothetical protein RHCH11_RHCH11_03773 [Beijerinckiaceae bacterium RH CH11]VVB49538.1 hypothetical protein RHAL8_03769 [Beijerinckiaceae bacterium RH AL8]VVC56912.1 hypothetical protein RHAL1_03847 [Beijerinckiaceae bacterium RH AL1]